MIEFQEYSGNPADGDGRHVAVSVAGVRVAGAVRLRQRYSATNPDAVKWYVTACIPGADVRPTEVADEMQARAWLRFLADLYSASPVGQGVSVDVEPPADVITEADIADDEEISAAELDDDERAYWDEVRECCGGRSFWCSHYRSYPPVVVAERW